MDDVFDGKLYFTREHMQGNFIPINLKLLEPKLAPKPQPKASSSGEHVQLSSKLMVLSPARKCSGPPYEARSCSHPAHLWATSDFDPRSEALGSPQAAGVM